MQRSPDSDCLPVAAAAEKMLQCLEMYEEGVALQTENFRRRFPEVSEAGLENLVQSWLERRDEA